MPEASSGTSLGDRVAYHYKRVDRVVFLVEAGAVTAAAAMMTAFIFLNIFYNFVARTYFSFVRGEAIGGWLVPTVLLAAFVLAIAYAAITRLPRLKEASAGVQYGLSFLVLGVMLSLCALMLVASSALVCTLLAVCGAAYWAAKIYKTQRWGLYAILAVVLLPTLAVTVNAPAGYTWAQSYARALLLWTAFMGGSMATSRARHLRIDAVRKAVPARLMARYNFISFLAAATFSGIFFYLAFVFTGRRFNGAGLPFPDDLAEIFGWVAAVVDAGWTAISDGEVPAWLKALALPVTLGLITIRFAMRSLLGLLGHVEETAGEIDISDLPDDREDVPGRSPTATLENGGEVAS